MRLTSLGLSGYRHQQARTNPDIRHKSDFGRVSTCVLVSASTTMMYRRDHSSEGGRASAFFPAGDERPRFWRNSLGGMGRA